MPSGLLTFQQLLTLLINKKMLKKHKICAFSAKIHQLCGIYFADTVLLT
jgi:hypothetical protein